MEILPVGDELFHADGRMDERSDTTKVTVTFRNFANASINGQTERQNFFTDRQTDSYTHICAAPNEALGIGSNVQ